MSGYLIAIEGLDGAGKSTQIDLLSSEFAKQGFNPHTLHFPRTDDNSLTGELIAQYLNGELGQLSPKLVALLFAADRVIARPHLDTWLAQSSVVILDRYVYSNIAYQCALNDNIDTDQLSEWVLALEYAAFQLPVPHLTIYLDVPFDHVQSVLNDVRSENNDDIYEKDIEFQKRVAKQYKQLSQKLDRFIVIDCAENDKLLTAEQIHNKIKSVINKHFPLLS